MMSSNDITVAEEVVADNNFCASCGIAEVDDVKLKPCDSCDLVKYCGDECQQLHRSEHEILCKERAAEIRDEILFRQPESSHLGDCPICFLPFPVDGDKYVMHDCCMKIVCNGCAIANLTCRGLDQIKGTTCPFCRVPIKSKEEREMDMLKLKRVEANDPMALRNMGKIYYYQKRDYEGAHKYFSKAAELGNAEAHHFLSVMYHFGRGVEKDKEKGLYHLEEAAIKGDPDARYVLGYEESGKGRVERAVKHWIIAANLGDRESIQELKVCYADGKISKEDFAGALRAYQTAVDAAKSPQREVGDALRKRMEDERHS